MVPGRLTRREALRLSGAALVGISGCMTNTDDDTPTPSNEPTRQSPTPTPTATETPTPPATPEAVGPDAIEFAVDTVQQFTSDHPARIRVSVTNTSSQPVFIRTGASGLVSDYRASNETGDGRLHIFPPEPEYVWLEDSDGKTLDTIIPDTRIDGCWQTPERESIAVNTIAFGFELAPGATEQDEYVLLDATDSECLPAGRYGVDDAIIISPLQTRSGTTEEGPSTSLLLRYTITVEDDATIQVSDANVTEGTPSKRDI